jgi:hypothetical protein
MEQEDEPISDYRPLSSEGNYARQLQAKRNRIKERRFVRRYTTIDVFMCENACRMSRRLIFQPLSQEAERERSK